MLDTGPRNCPLVRHLTQARAVVFGGEGKPRVTGYVPPEGHSRGRFAVLFSSSPSREAHAVESLTNSQPEVRRRRSKRISEAVPIIVKGVDILGQAFEEPTLTLTVNCHGCKFKSRHYISNNRPVSIQIQRPESLGRLRDVQGRVALVQRPGRINEPFQISVEFAAPGNVWGIASPPADWIPVPCEKASEDNS